MNYQSLTYLLTNSQKKHLVVLGFLLFVGMLFEMFSLGMLFPVIGIILNPEKGKSYPAVDKFLIKIGNPNQLEILYWGILILISVFLIKSIFLVFSSWKQSKFSADLSADLSEKLFFGYLGLPYTFHLQRNSAQLLRNIQTEIVLFTGISQAVINLALEFSVVLGITSMLIFVEPIGAIVVTLFLTFFAYLFNVSTKKRLLIWGESRQTNAGFLNQHLIQGLSGVKEVKIMGKEDYFLEEFSKFNKENAKIQTKTITLALIPRSYLELLSVIGLSGIIILMIVQNKPLNMVFPTIGLFAGAAFRLIPSVNRIMASFQTIRYSYPVVELLNKEFKIIKTEKNKTNQLFSNPNFKFQNIIKIENICYKYPQSEVNALNNICIQISKGDSIGIIGSSGSGKSTLVDIILGILTPEIGYITIDDFDLNQNIKYWQKLIGYVPQSIFLIDDSLKRNIAFGIPFNQIDDEAIKRAICLSQLNDFVNELPNGINTYVGERGVRLSGGQRQRIGIARALYHNPEILVLDEATSALDTFTEKSIMESVTALKGTKTLIIVAHRLSTVENCDKLYKLEKGSIIKEGEPDYVLKS